MTVLNNLLKEGAKDNKTVADFVEANGDDVSKYSKKVYKKFMNLIDSVGLGGGSKQVMDGLKRKAPSKYLLQLQKKKLNK